MSKGVLRYMDTIQSKSLESQNTVRESFCDSSAFLVQQIQKLFTQDIAVVFKSVNESGCEALIKLHGTISDWDALLKVDSTVGRRWCSFSRSKCCGPQGRWNRWS